MPGSDRRWTKNLALDKKLGVGQKTYSFEILLSLEGPLSVRVISPPAPKAGNKVRLPRDKIQVLQVRGMQVTAKGRHP